MIIDKNELINFQKTLKVLYVDDDINIQESMSEILAHIFAKVTFRINGQEGLDTFLANEDQFDIILSDIAMPKMDGITMGENIRKHNQRVPFIFLTAFSDATKLLDSINVGIDGYIVKPIQFKIFTRTIEKIVYKLYLEKQNIDLKNNLEEKVAEQTLDIVAKNTQLQYKYFHDQLTNIKNRYALYRDIQNSTKPRLMLIDINRFSTINNIYGKDIGDKLLVNFAQRLDRYKFEDCEIYRLSADQFVLFNGSHKDLNCKEIATNMLSSILIDPIKIDINNVQVDINISITISIAKDVDKDTILEKADMGLKYARDTHQPFIIYTPNLKLEQQYHKAIDAIGLVKTALKKDTLVPYFQPIVKKDHTSYECLVRILKDGEVISPGYFIDDIKHTAYYTELTKTMIDKSFDFFKDKTNMFSINLSFEDILNQHIIDHLKNKLSQTKMNKQLIVEILESESIDNFDIVKNFVTDMKKLDVKIAIDDFGSGYSNFVYLHELNPDFLKIDGSLIKDIDTNTKSQIIVKTIVSFAQQLGIKTIAEYIHNKSVYDIVSTMGIDGLQGYYLGKPSKDLLTKGKIC